MIEEYQVITRGHLAGGCPTADVKQNLQEQLGLEASVAGKLLSGSVVKIKSRLDWNKAQAWQRRLTQLGLHTELVLQLNAACLKAGFCAITKSETPALKAGEILIPDSKRLAPTLVSFAHIQNIITEQKKLVARITTFSSYWNPVFLLVACAFIGLALESYLLRILTVYLQQGVLATVAGIVFLLLMVLCLPRFLQPRQLHSLKTIDDHRQINILEKPGLRIGSKTHQLYDGEGAFVATLCHASKHAKVLCPRGRLLFHWQQRFHVADSSQDVAVQIRDQFMEDTAFGTISEYFYYLQSATNFFGRVRRRKAARPGAVRWKLDSARPILDADQQLVALVYQQPDPAIKLLKADLSSTDQLLLLAFCCQLIRNPLA